MAVRQGVYGCNLTNIHCQQLEFFKCVEQRCPDVRPLMQSRLLQQHVGDLERGVKAAVYQELMATYMHLLLGEDLRCS